MHSFSFQRLIGAAGLAALLALAAFTPLAAVAQADPEGPPPPDAAVAADAGGPPVARLSVVEGDFSVQPADASAPVGATVNAPLQQNDYVSTGPTGRGEIQFDGENALRIDNNVQLRLINLDPQHREAQLAEGDVEIRAFRGGDGAVQIDTPSLSIRPEDAGSVRVGVTQDGQTRITVRSGRAQIFWQNGAQDISAGSTIAVTGNPDNPTINAVETLAVDEFDGFNRTRDQNVNVAFRDPNVSAQIPGTGDLSQYGQWQTDPSYGQVWVPQTPPDWAPYTDGNWVWQPAYGYTWVSYEPWGWAPYHYGRWYYNAAWSRWAWTPPPVGNGPPRYAPALVGFVTFGSGGGFAAGAAFGGVSLAFSNIGWVPLGPHEIAHPWWGPRAAWGPNITNVNIRAVYANANAPHGFVGVSAQAFANGQVYRHTAFYGTGSVDVRTATIVRGPVPVAPAPGSLRFAARTPTAAVNARLFTQRTFAGNAPVGRVTPFSTQRLQAVAAIRQSAAQEPLRELPPASSLRSSEAVPETSRAAFANERQVGPSDAWARFNGTRDPSAPERRNATSTADRRAPDANRPSYSRPAGSSYEPAAASRPGETYGRPANAYGNGGASYSRPSTSYGRPASSYSRPASSYGRPASSYSRPASSYGRPAASYARPSQSYSRPAANRPAPRAAQSRPAPAHDRR
jgi:hypothetical protein